MLSSVFELYKIGIGPSSSHTVGPMRAAMDFVERLGARRGEVAKLKVELLGSLAATGWGHGTDRAVLAGLMGLAPDTGDPREIQLSAERVKKEKTLRLGGDREVPFSYDDDLLWDRKKPTPEHPNTVCFTAFSAGGAKIVEEEYYSVGGGFVERKDAEGRVRCGPRIEAPKQPDLPYPFETMADLLEHAKKAKLSFSEIMEANEAEGRGFTREQVRERLRKIWRTMKDTIAAGLSSGERELPGGLHMARKAKQSLERLRAEVGGDPKEFPRIPFGDLRRTHIYALAVGEENAAGGRVVTAPTNGAAAIVPAVLKTFQDEKGLTDDEIGRALLTAGAVGLLIKEHASISGAEVGCQGEVGSASAMAAAAAAEMAGGSPQHCEYAAEIAIEHNLGLTCDPIKGLVQAPCIERNAMGAAKAIQAASYALMSTGQHLVSFDRVVRTMKRTGEDMNRKYKETSEGGLAVSQVEC
ncbi:L-serine ammonia-lyase [bacterium]|nr:L-serine ammonia-lyase [bacterium]